MPNPDTSFLLATFMESDISCDALCHAILICCEIAFMLVPNCCGTLSPQQGL